MNSAAASTPTSPLAAGVAFQVDVPQPAPSPTLGKRKMLDEDEAHQQQEQRLLQGAAPPAAKRMRKLVPSRGNMQLGTESSLNPEVMDQEQQLQTFMLPTAQDQQLLQLQQQAQVLGQSMQLQQEQEQQLLETMGAEAEEPEEEMADASEGDLDPSPAAAGAGAVAGEAPMQDEEMLDEAHRQQIARQLLQKILMEQQRVPRPLPLPPLPPVRLQPEGSDSLDDS